MLKQEVRYTAVFDSYDSSLSRSIVAWQKERTLGGLAITAAPARARRDRIAHCSLHDAVRLISNVTLGDVGRRHVPPISCHK